MSMGLADNQKHAIINMALALKRLWTCGQSQEQAMAANLMTTLGELDNAMRNPDNIPPDAPIPAQPGGELVEPQPAAEGTAP